MPVCNPFATRRRRSTLAGLAVLALALGFASAHAAPATGAIFPSPVYVTLQKSNAVEELPSGRVCKDLPGAHYIAVSPNGRALLVSSASRPEAYLVDAGTCDRLATFDVGPVAQGVAISPDGRWGLAVSQGNSSVAIIDLHARKVAKTLHFDAYPHNAVFAADGRHAYATLQGDSGVAVIDMRTLAQVAVLPAFKLPHNLDLAPGGKTLWLRDFVGRVTAIDAATGKPRAAPVAVGPSHAGIDVLANGRLVFTGAIGGHDVDVIDPSTLKVVKRIDVGEGPHGVRSSPDSRWVYAAVTGTDRVAVIDARTLKVVEQVPVDGVLPFWIAVAGKD